MKKNRLLAVAVAIPLFSLLFMATIFGDGRIENLPVGAVDGSNTPFTQEIIRRADASPVIDIAPEHIFSNRAQARQAMQDMEIYGYIVMPPGFTQDLYSSNTPTVECYFHYALLAVGGEIQGALVKALGSSSASLVSQYGNYAGITPEQQHSITLPTNGVFTSTYNSTLNYGVFLSYPFFFIFFQIFILVFTVYAIGTDMGKQWLSKASGSIVKGVGKKMLPYTSIFIMEAIIANFTFFCIMGIPFHGSLFAANISSILLVIASVALGCAIISLIPKTAVAISIASMIGALGATASGVTFPIENMYPAFRIICSLFPIRHFILANQALLYNEAGFGYSWENYSFLLIGTGICIATLPLLKKAICKGWTSPLPAMWGVAIVMLGGTIGYGFLYGLMYRPNIVTEVPIATVDLSQSPLGREYLRNLDATQGVHIYAECTDLRQAGELMKSSKVKGIICLPHNFAALAAEGKEATFAVFETTASFLYYLTIQKAVAATMQEFNNSLRISSINTLPLQQQLLMAQTPSFNTKSIAVYNSNGGYGSYLLPIAIIVILFQTMLMSGGILAGSRTIHPFRYLPLLVAGYFLLSLFLTGLIPLIFNLPALANRLELYLFMLLYILSTAAFTGCATLFLKDPEEVMLYVPFFSVGLIFLSGTSFPMVQIPHLWQIVHYLLPSSPAIVGYIKLNSMGGTLHNIAPQAAILLVQLLIYGAIFILYSRKVVNLHKRKPQHRDQWQNADS